MFHAHCVYLCTNAHQAPPFVTLEFRSASNSLEWPSKCVRTTRLADILMSTMFVCDRPSAQPTLHFGQSLVQSPRPFIKWVGGKRWLAPRISEALPEVIGRYLEPFVGGGAVALHLSEKAGALFLNDANSELIDTYIAVRDHREELVESLESLAALHTRDHYYDVRARGTACLTLIERAARLIYLNKTCFNGLYRVNRRGEFNVPIGTETAPALYDAANLRSVSQILKRCTLSCQDYVAFLRNTAVEGDVIYLDPPYAPVSQYSDFKRYTKEQFQERDQVELAHLYSELVERGAYPILSNSWCDLTRDLYKNHIIEIVYANRAINKNGDGRGAVPEILVLPRRRPWH